MIEGKERWSCKQGISLGLLSPVLNALLFSRLPGCSLTRHLHQGETDLCVWGGEEEEYGGTVALLLNCLVHA